MAKKSKLNKGSTRVKGKGVKVMSGIFPAEIIREFMRSLGKKDNKVTIGAWVVLEDDATYLCIQYSGEKCSGEFKVYEDKSLEVVYSDIEFL